jgi:OOP family OmpA-OmpF porin
LARGDAPTPFAKSETVEGQVIRILYLVAQGSEGHTSLELLRNYEAALEEAGLSQTLERADQANTLQDVYKPFIFQTPQVEAAWDGPITQADNIFYVAYHGAKDGKDINVAVLTMEYTGGPYDSKAYSIRAGDVLVYVDVVTAKSVENKMVVVKAADMADALATKGSIDLYGIYFDVDKSDIKPDSTKTLDEIASLLKIDLSLKLEISGHTDNTGDKDHNMALSEARAKAVVDVLVKKYGIDPARLEAKGYGDTMPVASNDTEDGRAKNRRVELRKI